MLGVELMLSPEPDNYGANSALRLRGMRTIEQARKVQAKVLQQHSLMIVAKGGLASGALLRMTPGLFNTTAELDRLVAAIGAEQAMFA